MIHNKHVLKYPHLWYEIPEVANRVKLGNHHWLGWPTDPDSNVGIDWVWPGLIKVELYAEAYISGTTNWLCVSYSRGGGTGPADPAAAGPIIYGEITTKDDLTTWLKNFNIFFLSLT